MVDGCIGSSPGVVVGCCGWEAPVKSLKWGHVNGCIVASVIPKLDNVEVSGQTLGW